MLVAAVAGVGFIPQIFQTLPAKYGMVVVDDASWTMSITVIPGTPRTTATRATSVAASAFASAGSSGNERAKASLKPFPPNFGSASRSAKTARTDSARAGGLARSRGRHAGLRSVQHSTQRES